MMMKLFQMISLYHYRYQNVFELSRTAVKTLLRVYANEFHEFVILIARNEAISFERMNLLNLLQTRSA
jgi:hypothetical protein